MTPQVQSILALLVVAVAITWLVWRAVANRRNPGCGDSCGAISPEVRRLQAHLKRRR
jgi:hypothetical protein